MARNGNHKKRLNQGLPFWETGVNPITMRREESYAVAEIEKNDTTTKTRV